MKCLNKQWGFTLIEMLVVVLIIGILGAIALPQFQKAVLKSRYSGMMPIAKALAEANEVFYLEHGEYSENPADLPVAGRDRNTGAYPDGTRVLMYDEDGLSYVRVTNDNVPNARYLVYQKHSENFPDTTQCEASDDRANELCVALGGQIIEGGNSSGESEWTAYLLSGRYGSGDQFIVNPVDDSGDEPGGDEPGTNTDPEPEPQTPQCEGEQPADITASSSGATGTATCVNGQWKYQWTGGSEYSSQYDYCPGNSAYACAGATFSGQGSECSGRAANGCVGSIFSGENASCNGDGANGCAGATFSGRDSECLGGYTNGCVGSTFSGENASCKGYYANTCVGSTFSGKSSNCYGTASNGCTGTTFSGENAFCYGNAANACAGATIQAGAYCWANNPSVCDGAKYGEDPTGTRTGIGVCSGSYCPDGAPITGSWNGDATTGSYTIDSWKGGYCNPNLMVSGKCPSGSPKQGGGCWDGNGNQTDC